MSSKGKRGGPVKKGAKPATKPTEASPSAAKLSTRTCTGVLASQEASRDIKIFGFSLTFYGKELISDTMLELNYGRRYGLIGQNGSGKTQMLKAIAAREIPIPSHIDIFHLSEEVAASDRTALQSVIDIVETEHKRLEAEEERLLVEEGPDSAALQNIYERLDRLEPATFTARAGELLHGLGFSNEMMQKQTKDLSGGWRMRVALARALFIKPTLLLLDEPTNHLDLDACVWLEEYLQTYDSTVVLVSHSQDFLNGVCTNIIHLRFGQLTVYGGNYDAFIRTKAENEANQMKQYTKQQDDIAHIKQFIASCGTYANLVKQANSKQKIIDKMEAAGLVQKVVPEYKYTFGFVPMDPLSLPVLHFEDVSFSYSGVKKDYLYSHLDFSIDMDSRVALVGPNGAGKSTLLKLMAGDLTPTEGRVHRNPHLTFGRYHQHSTDQLEDALTPLEYMRKIFPNYELEEEQWRARLGMFGVAGNTQTQPIGCMSDGQKSKLVFCEMVLRTPQVLLLDEPTNHLDMQCIDALAEAINASNLGLLLISHDFRLINQVAKEIWLCDNKNVVKFKGDIKDYKHQIKKAIKGTKLP